MNSTKLLTLAAVTAMASIFSTVTFAEPGQGQGQGQGQAQGQRLGLGNGFGHIANHIISRYDTDGDHAISLDEFLTRRLARVDVRFDHIDSNDDGLISLEELVSARPGPRPGSGDIDPVEMRECLEEKLDRELPVRPSLEERFVAADTNGDGFLDLDEFITARTIVITTRFNKIDTDANGLIEVNELVDSLKNRRAFRKAVRECREELTTDTDDLEI